MSPFGISLLMLVAFAGFGYLAVRKLAILRHLRPEPRWDRPMSRMKSVLVNGFLQRRMIHGERKPGVMHAVIFTGFMILLLRKLQHIAIGYDESVTYSGLAGGAFAALKDGVELAVLIACGYALYRRLVQKPRRLERNREALVILSLIIAIMVTDYAFDAFRFALYAASDPAIAHERSFAIAGAALASGVASLSEPALAAGYHGFYWLQLVLVFSFLVILPTGEHFHIVTALPTLFFRRGRPGNTVPFVDLEAAMASADEGIMKVGARSVRDLTWKEGLDAFTCTECGRCKDACPTFLTGKPLSLKWVHDSVKHHLSEQRLPLAHGAPDDALPALVPGVISDETLWSCTTCGYCEAACPIELEHLPKFYRLRQRRVMMVGEFPQELRAAFAKILHRAGVSIAVLGARETSTGECVRRAGNEMLFQQLAATLVATFAEFGIRRIVTCDPHAYNTLRNEYPALGGNYEVVHHTQLIARLLAEGRIRLRRELQRVVYHDPCYLARHNGEFEAPRAILQALVRDTPLEFDLSRDRTMCCGAGGARMWMEEKIGKRINIARVEQALTKAPRVIATACPYCAVMMSDGTKALTEPGEVLTRDIAELVEASLDD